ncbi:DNA-directed RNA polymerase subunit K [Candidatus Bathyarchaeota archaeon]|jgi:DNA-directed RNA polymerase subunit K/omega|nr:DNA-directed RNA polymerase subunit K [Candidatus Bathyarchaeota archaeon]
MRHQRKAKTGPKKIKTVQLIGPKKLTRFERARVIGARALQISMGAPVLVDVSRSSRSPIDIALMELEQGVLPISIRRTLPDGESQNIPLKVLLEGEKRK